MTLVYRALDASGRDDPDEAEQIMRRFAAQNPPPEENGAAEGDQKR